MMKVIRVIEANILRGKGIGDDPVRIVRQYWSFDGKLLAECDAWLDERDSPYKQEILDTKRSIA